ncbi:folate-binding protein [Rhodobacteraceae bacterium HSP-20]|uniref:Folate-binding protein n=1 Tax=Paragemmobacter amnigenus TaxID=2852097 RepID=A0ABS6IY92_9RHOB|nr:folate-binding protein YgfZ [Rhodobacter amnigenus]MBU9696484.1 folate-binding protein [Rhodobacter amnigenus]MBV4387711.1 folate-binding protein [Rhodobacter amnigenus]
MQGEAAQDRRVVAVEGADGLTFLQGMVTNDVLSLGKGPGLVWAALLTPQGKYLADFLIARLADGTLLLDLPEGLADATLRRLSMYRLRADVRLVPSPLQVQRGLGDAPAGALPDPRHPALGWRAYTESAGSAPAIDWDAIRVAHVIPEAGRELVVDDSYILEAGFERLHGVDFRKGCYVGQEVTARMKHKTELKKGLVRVRIAGDAPFGADITAQDGKVAGTLFTRAGDRAIAHLRLDRATGTMQAGAAQVWLDDTTG